jgi:hypothetical protein
VFLEAVKVTVSNVSSEAYRGPENEMFVFGQHEVKSFEIRKNWALTASKIDRHNPP